MNYRLKHFLVILIVIQLYVTLIENYDHQQHQHAQEYTYTYPCCNYFVEIHCINHRIVQIGRNFNFRPNLQYFQYLVKKDCHEVLDGEIYFYECDKCRQKPFLIYESDYLNPGSQPSSVSSQSIQTNKPISFSEKSTTPIQKLKTSTTLKPSSARQPKPTTTPRSTTIKTAQSSKIKHPTMIATTKSTQNLQHSKEENDHDSDQARSKSPEPKKSNSTPLLITFIVILIVINFILIGYNTKKILKKIQQNLENQNAEMNGQIQTGPTNRQIPPQMRINPNVNGELYENRDPIYASLDWNR